MDIFTLRSAQAYAENLVAGAISGVATTTVDEENNAITMNFNNGESATLTIQTPQAKVDAAVNAYLGEKQLASKSDIENYINTNNVGTTPIVTSVNVVDEMTMIEPNKFYDLGECSVLYLELVPPTDDSIVNEYMIAFDSGEVPTELATPLDTVFSSTFEIEANKHYEINIIGTSGICVSFDRVVDYE